MSLSSRFFAATYDAMLAGVEKAGLGAPGGRLYKVPPIIRPVVVGAAVRA